MSIQRASSSTFPPRYVRVRCKHQRLQLGDVCLARVGGHRASSLAGEHPRSPGRRGTSSTDGISHAYGVRDVQCGPALALQKSRALFLPRQQQAFPKHLPQKPYVPSAHIFRACPRNVHPSLGWRMAQRRSLAPSSGVILCGAHTQDYSSEKGGNMGVWLRGTQ